MCNKVQRGSGRSTIFKLQYICYMGGYDASPCKVCRGMFFNLGTMNAIYLKEIVHASAAHFDTTAVVNIACTDDLDGIPLLRP